MQEDSKKEIRENITAKVKPSIIKKAQKKAERKEISFSRIVEKALQEHVKKPD